MATSDAVTDRTRDLAPPGYQLEEVIGVGATGVVHRAIGPAHEVLAVKIARDYDLAVINRLRDEVALLQRIHHPRIVGLRDYGVISGLPWYAMDLLPGRTLTQALDAGRPGFREAVILLYRLVEIVEAIHTRGYLHGDLKPDNIFLDEDGDPVIGDLDLIREGTRGSRAGTPLYAAPEQIRREPLDARSDLYALGCLAHMLFAGVPPFADPTTLLADHLQRQPPRLDIPAPLADLVDRLLAKPREDRPAYARDVRTLLAPWCDAVGAAAEVTPHLYNPRLQGRRDLLQRFRRFASFGAAGAGMLIAGESGVGKTAVAERLAALLADQGWRVVRASASGTTSPLAPLQPLLQTMVDVCWIRGPAFTRRMFGDDGGTLRLYQPAIGELPGIVSASAVALSTKTGRPALFRDLEQALRVLTADQRLALIVDDLHRADELTLAFLRRALHPSLYDAGLLFVGLYRPEHAVAVAVVRSGDTQLIRLGPLAPEEVERMVADMLACREPPAPLVRALVREAQGNPFYVMEYLRLAVGRGLVERTREFGWAMSRDVAELPIPDSVSSLMSERLAGLSDAARKLIRVAALIGLEFPPELLRDATSLDSERTRTAIEELLSHRMLQSAADDALRFVHDRLRNYVLERLAPDPARSERVARALERHYFGRVAFPSWFEAIADHWRSAGKGDMAAAFYVRAADYALERAAHHDAQRLYRAALNDLPGADSGARGRLKVRLAVAELSVGALDMARATMLEALAAVGSPVPTTRRGWRWALVREVWMRLNTPLIAPAAPGQPIADNVRAAAFMAEQYFFRNDLLRMYVMTLRAVNEGNRVEAASNARPYAYLGFAAGTLRLTGRARKLLARSRDIAHAQGEPADIVYGWLAAAAFHAGHGRWDEARSALRCGADVNDAELNPIGHENLTSNQCHMLYYAGAFAESLAAAHEFREAAAARGHAPRQAWGWTFAARITLLRGHPAEAMDQLERARALAGGVRDGFLEPMIPGLASLALARLGQQGAAKREAELALKHLSGRWPTNFSTREAYLATASAFRLLKLRHLERRTVVALTRFAWLFPMAAPLARCYRATLGGRGLRRHRRESLASDAARRGARPDEILVRQRGRNGSDGRLAALCAELGVPREPTY